MIVRNNYCTRTLFHRMFKNEIRLQGHFISLPLGYFNWRRKNSIARAKHYDKKSLLFLSIHLRHKQVIDVLRRPNVPRIAVFVFDQFSIRATPPKFKSRNNAKCFRPSYTWDILSNNFTIIRFRQSR